MYVPFSSLSLCLSHLSQLWRHLELDGTSSADVSVELRQGGTVRLHLEFDAQAKPLVANGSNGSIASGDRTASLAASPSRFSIGRRRAPTDHDDD